MRERIETRLSGSTPADDPAAAALATLPVGAADAWFDRPLTPAAVLLPLVPRGDALSVLLTQRTAHLRDHPGQISFPGGRAEPGDRTPADTALREVHEEIGIPPANVRIAGYLEPLAVVTGFAVTPIVGFVEGEVSLVLDRFEVEDVFEVPLDFLLERRNRVNATRRWRGIDARLYEYHFDGRRIWGATAFMLKSFIDLIE
jgi:8-oxo-dGTP pyrophosphatase MutT (NUDIX family)